VSEHLAHPPDGQDAQAIRNALRPISKMKKLTLIALAIAQLLPFSSQVGTLIHPGDDFFLFA
jgi:hypothetical protein